MPADIALVANDRYHLARLVHFLLVTAKPNQGLKSSYKSSEPSYFPFAALGEAR
jgi:hypothetical protein